MHAHGSVVSEENIQELLNHAYDAIRNHELEAAAESIERALALDFDDNEVVTALKYVNFWRDRGQAVREIATGFEQAEYLVSQWRLFNHFVERVGQASEQCLYAIRQHVFDSALNRYRQLLDESFEADAELLLRIGRCYKGKGEYDTALETLQRAASQKKNDSEIYAELADCYAFVNEIQRSKAFFREAFFLGAHRIDLGLLESELITRLVAKLRELGYESPELEEWLPVYGVLYGVFTVKRELRSIEYGRLKQSIYALEREHSDKRGKNSLLVPRLINRYFWLIDHYLNTGEDRSKIDEVLLKLRSIDPKIYEQYIT